MYYKIIKLGSLNALWIFIIFEIYFANISAYQRKQEKNPLAALFFFFFFVLLSSFLLSLALFFCFFSLPLSTLIFIHIYVFLNLYFSLCLPGFGGLISRPMNSPAYLTNIEYANIYLALVVGRIRTPHTVRAGSGSLL